MSPNEKLIDDDQPLLTANSFKIPSCKLFNKVKLTNYKVAQTKHFTYKWHAATLGDDQDISKSQPILLFTNLSDMNKYDRIDNQMNSLEDKMENEGDLEDAGEYGPKYQKEYNRLGSQTKRDHRLTKQIKKVERKSIHFYNVRQLVEAKKIRRKDFLMVKINHSIYYSPTDEENEAFSTSNTEDGIFSSLNPTAKDRKYVIASKGEPLYLYNGAEWSNGKSIWQYNGHKWIYEGKDY